MTFHVNFFIKFFIYECHYRLTEVIQPVNVNGRPPGYFLLRQILTDREKFIRQNRPDEKELALLTEECRQGIMEYINSVRLKKSKELLNEWKIVEVSRMVGISDSNYFSRIFKKKYGISPEHYKQKFLIKKAP